MDIQEYTALFQKGEHKGFAFFYKNLCPALRYYAYKILLDEEEAKNVVQDSFIKIWKIHSDFNHPQVIKSWLYTTVRNHCKTQIRKRKVANKYTDKYLLMLENSYDNSIEDDIVLSEVGAEIFAIIDMMPTECGKIFTMLYIKGKKAREIAEELQLSISTVKNQKARGLAILRKRLSELTSVNNFEGLNLCRLSPIFIILQSYFIF